MTGGIALAIILHDMSAWPFRSRPSRSALLPQFAVLRLLVIPVITAALSVILSYYLHKHLLEREWGFTAD